MMTPTKPWKNSICNLVKGIATSRLLKNSTFIIPTIQVRRLHTCVSILRWVFLIHASNGCSLAYNYNSYLFQDIFLPLFKTETDRNSCNIMPTNREGVLDQLYNAVRPWAVKLKCIQTDETRQFIQNI